MDKNKNKVSFTTNSILNESYKSPILLISIFLGISIWIIDPFIDVFFLEEGDFYQQITQHNIKEIYYCSIFSILIIGFGLFCSDFIIHTKHKEESVLQYEQIVSASIYMLLFVDNHYIYRAANHAYLNYRGLRRVDVIGKHVSEVIGHEAFENGIKQHMDLCLSGLEGNHQVWMDVPNRGLRYLDAHYTPFKEKDGSITGIVIVIRDYTEKKKIEDTLHASEERLRAIYDQSNDAIFLFDIENDKIIDFNKKAIMLLGYSPKELSVATISKILPHGMEKFNRFTQTVNKAESYMTDKLTFLTKNEMQIPAEISVSCIKIKDKTYLLALVHEITESQKA